MNKYTAKGAISKATDWKSLKKIAEHSPKSYAPRIRKRYKKALKALDELRNKCGKGHILCGTSLKIGCPHCSWNHNHSDFVCKIDVKHCIWSSCMDLEMACINTAIAGSYYPSYITLQIESIGILPPFELGHYEQTRLWLVKHIQWTNKYEWGKYYKRYK